MIRIMNGSRRSGSNEMKVWLLLLLFLRRKQCHCKKIKFRGEKENAQDKVSECYFYDYHGDDHGTGCICMEFFVVEKLATKLAFTVVRPTDRPQVITYAISLMIICIMCPCMSLAATLLFKKPSFGTWIQTWGMNMPMALIWQMFYCGPLVRLIFRTLFRKQLQEQ